MIVCGSDAQLFTDQGLLSGSGMTVIPTATVVPTAEFRLQYSRISYLMSGGNGVNVISLSSGFSSSLEGYMRVTGEQLGLSQSQLAYGFGGKLRIPALLPVVRRLALWMETTSSDQYYPSRIFPSDAFRTALTATIDSNGIHPTILVGMTRMENLIRPLVGAGVTIAAGNHVQVSLELVHGYFGRKSAQAAATASMRIFPNLSLHASPGYLSTPNISTWTFSFGISCSTTDIDFHPVYEEVKGDEYILPSIEEMEKDGQQTPTGGGGGSLLDESPLGESGNQVSPQEKPETKNVLQQQPSHVKPPIEKSDGKEQTQEEKHHE